MAEGLVRLKPPVPFEDGSLLRSIVRRPLGLWHQGYRHLLFSPLILVARGAARPTLSKHLVCDLPSSCLLRWARQALDGSMACRLDIDPQVLGRCGCPTRLSLAQQALTSRCATFEVNATRA